ncbi:CD225/dispanin family protein [Xanthomonas sp. LMG 8992]|uniref:CD225/dispanin family protein n=1 Tax=Xanthomonas sp. LMG 8992 TaxID=1591157 RepID=UPI00136ECC73|nr:CD225/dispanin family protein [Xanthomonas sp. LMG 8992]
MNQVVPPPAPNATGIYVPNNLVWAILSTLFCCLPLGIVSIVYASQVDGRRAAGDIAGAREASRKAGLWAMWSAFALPILMALWFLLFGGLAFLGSLTSH